MTALAVDIDRGQFTTGQESIDMIEFHVHAGTHAHARVMANALGLVEGVSQRRVLPGKPGHPPRTWRSWTGWAPDASREVPVRIEVVASDTAPATASAAISTAAPG
ncbi:MAG: hypothetical protein ACRCYX_10545 [Dermatophilaceae bacterium]